MPNEVVTGVYDTTVLGIRRGVASVPRPWNDHKETFYADVVVNGTEHVVEFHLLRDVQAYSGSVGLSAAFPGSKDALSFLGALARRIAKGEVVAFPIRAVI